MKRVRVFNSVQGMTNEECYAIKALEHAPGYIRGELVERLQLRRLPELHFTLDLSQEHVERIERLLKEMKKDNPSAPREFSVIGCQFSVRKRRKPPWLRPKPS